MPWETLDMFAGTTHHTGPLHSAWRLPRLCPCCHWKRKKVQINHHLPNIFNISFHTAALQLPRGTSPSLPCKAFPLGHAGGSLCNLTRYPHHRHMSLNPAMETGHGAAQPGLAPLELPSQCPLEGQHSRGAGLRTAAPSVP